MSDKAERAELIIDMIDKKHPELAVKMRGELENFEDERGTKRTDVLAQDGLEPVGELAHRLTSGDRPDEE